MARKYILNGRIYEETGERKVIVNGRILEETTSSGAANDLAGTATLTFSTSAAATATGALQGTAALAFSITGADLTSPAVGNDLIGTAALTFGESAQLTATGALQGTAAIVFGESAALTAGVGALTGTAALAFGENAQLTATADIAGTASLTFSISGANLTDASAVKVTCTLVDVNGQPLANLTDIHWAWFDEQDPNLLTSPTDQGDSETTDNTGLIEISLTGSALTVGQTGTLILRSDDGSSLGAYNKTLEAA